MGLEVHEIWQEKCAWRVKRRKQEEAGKPSDPVADLIPVKGGGAEDWVGRGSDNRVVLRKC